MASSNPKTVASILALAAGFPAAHVAARPPVIIPPKTSAPATNVAPPAANTTPVNIGNGQTLNLSPQDLANVKAWQAKLAQVATARGVGAPSIPTFDGSMGSKVTKQVAVPTHGGGTGLLTIPKDVEVGVWFAGKNTPSATAPAAAPANPTIVQQAVATQTTTVDASVPRLTPVAMTQEGLDSAMAKYPASEGWRQIWLADGGKVFAKANPCEAHALAGALARVDSGSSGDTQRTGDTQRFGGDTARNAVNDARYLAYASSRSSTVGDATATASATAIITSAPASRVSSDMPDRTRYAIAPDSIAGQIADIRSAMTVVKDDGRLERALALSQMSLPGAWNEGIKRLSAAYMANPDLVSSKFAEDFSDAGDTTLRRLLGRAVTDAQQHPNAASWVAVAAIMATQDRPTRAAEMLDRAKKTTTDAATLDRIDAISQSLRKLAQAAPSS